MAPAHNVRIDSVDYSVDFSVTGHPVRVVDSLQTVTMSRSSAMKTEHGRSSSRRRTVIAPEYVKPVTHLPYGVPTADPGATADDLIASREEHADRIRAPPRR